MPLPTNMRELPAPAATNRGKWGEGGLVAKTLDVLSTPQYAVAGAGRALLRGENPLEGLTTGVVNRASNIDTLKDLGLGGAPGFALGMGLDIVTDPTNLLPFIGAGAKGARLAEVARGVRTFGSAEEIMADTAEVGTRLAMNRAGRRVAARQTYMSTLGATTKAEAITLATTYPERHQIAIAAARRAAKTTAVTIDKASPSELARLLSSTMADGQILADASSGMRRDWRDLATVAVKRAGDALRDVGRFGPAGPMIANALDAASLRMHRLASHRAEYLQAKLLKPLMAFDEPTRKIFTAVASGTESITKLPAELHPVVEEWKVIRDQLFKELSDHGVREADFTISAKLNALAGQSADDVNIIERLISEIGTTPQEELLQLAGKLTPAGRKVWGYIQPNAHLVTVVRSPVTGALVATMPLQHVAEYAPRILNAKGVALMRRIAERRDKAAITEVLSKASHLTADQVIEFADALKRSSGFRPGDVMESFQIRRLAEAALPKDLFELDPLRWMPSYVERASNRVAHASVWGGMNGNFEALRAAVRAHGGDVAARHVDSLWDAVTGGGSRGFWDGTVNTINKISSDTLLGPRTALMQLTQLANPAAKYGVRNTLAAMGTVLRDFFKTVNSADDSVLAVIKRSGALLPTSDMLADTSNMGKLRQTWHNIMGVRAADSAVRAVSAVAAAFWVEDAVKALRQAAAAGREVSPHVARGLAELGLDAGALARQAHDLTPAQLANAMQRGAGITQFMSRPQDLPLMFRGTGGKFFLKFKSFAFQQSAFLKENVIDLLKDKKTFHAGATAALKYVGAFSYLYSDVAQHLAMLANKENPTDDDLAYMQNLMLTGAVGVWGDATVAAFKGNKQLWGGFLTGPNPVMLATYAGAPVQAIRNQDVSKLKPLLPGLIRQPLNAIQYMGDQ